MTGAGIEGVTVTLMFTTSGGHQYEATTDAKGTFRITAVEPGAYRPVVRKDGFLPSQVNYFGGGSAIQVRAADTVESRFELIPPGSIRGRVIGLDGNPAADVEVTLGPQPARTKTGEDGTFVFEKVEAGQHSLMARGGSAPTYFPGAVDPALAEEIQLAPGADQGGYEIRLQSATVHRVHGVVLDTFGKPLAKPLIRLVPEALGSDTFGFVLGMGGATLFEIGPPSAGVPAAREDPVMAGDDGSFELPAVREGDWALRVELDSMHQNVPISVRQDTGDLQVRLQPEFEIHDA